MKVLSWFALQCAVSVALISTSAPASAVAVTFNDTDCPNFSASAAPGGLTYLCNQVVVLTVHCPSMSLVSPSMMTITCNHGAAPVTPQCSLVATPNTVSSGARTTLSATCSPAATSYTWTNVTATGTTATAYPTATTTFSVRGTNAAGNGNTATAVVTVNSSALVPQCTLSANPSSLRAPGWVILTATCSPAATSYSWNNITGNTSSVYVYATTNFTVRGSNQFGQGNLASTTVTLQ